MGTVLGILSALFAWVSEAHLPEGFSFLLAAASLIFLALPTLLSLHALPSLEQAGDKLTPRALDLFGTNSKLGFIHLGILLFGFAGLTFLLTGHAAADWFLPFWLIGLGITVDICHLLYKQILHHINPAGVLQSLKANALHAIQDSHDANLCSAIDAIAEIGAKGVKTGGTLLGMDALQELKDIYQNYLGAAKSIGHRPDQEAEATGQDTLSYTSFYLYKRLELIHQRALETRNQVICSYLATILGKMTLDAAKCDISLAVYPLHYLGKFTKEDTGYQLFDAVDTAACTLTSVAHALVTEQDVSFLEIRDPFLSIISTFEQIAGDAFKRDKQANIALLTAPLRDLKQLFESEKLINHPDTPVILQNIDRVLGAFDALEQVMRTIPNLPEEVNPPQ